MDRNQWFSSLFLYLSEMKISFSPNWLYKWLFGNRFHNTQYLDYPKTIVRGLVHFVTPTVVLALLWGPFQNVESITTKHCHTTVLLAELCIRLYYIIYIYILARIYALYFKGLGGWTSTLCLNRHTRLLAVFYLIKK